MSATLRGAIVGFGKIAETTHLPALAAAGLEVVAIVDAVPARLEAAAGVAKEARRYERIEKVLAEERLDFIDICTPPHLHFDAAQAALEAGVHVLCEKPLVLSLAHGRALETLAARRERTIACMHNWTQAPILWAMREWVRGGRLGPLREAELHTLRTEPAAVAGDRGNWRIDPEKAGGGILFDHGWHGMSILLRLFGEPAVSAKGAVAKRRFLELPVEDTVEAIVRFASGKEARFEATWAAKERSNRAIARCEAGHVEVENDRLRVFRGEKLIEEQTFPESLAGGGYRPNWTAGIAREFRDEIETPAHRGHALAEAITCLQLLSAIYASAARSNETVELATL